MNNYRKSNQPIRLTEQDLHFLVEETVKGYLRENGMQEDVWGGLKNAWNGVVNHGNFNLGDSYKSGNWASSFQKYGQEAQKNIGQMQRIAQSSNNIPIASSLSKINQNIGASIQNYNQMAQDVSNGNANYNNKFAVNNPFQQKVAQDATKVSQAVNNTLGKSQDPQAKNVGQTVQKAVQDVQSGNANNAQMDLNSVMQQLQGLKLVDASEIKEIRRSLQLLSNEISRLNQQQTANTQTQQTTQGQQPQGQGQQNQVQQPEAEVQQKQKKQPNGVSTTVAPQY